MTAQQIEALEALETSAGQAGDLMMAAICQIAMEGEPNGPTMEALTPSERAILFQTYADQSTDTDWLQDAALAECERVIAEAEAA